jgi:hypothetical protein
MSDDLVNQITLNYLISSQQLNKLNKKIKQKEEDKLKSDKEIYKDQISELFTKCLNDEFPNDILQEVKHSFAYFVEKSIYYLKLKADNLAENKECSAECSANAQEEESIDEDDDEDEEDEDDDEEEEEEGYGEEEAQAIESSEEEESREQIAEKRPQKVFKKASKPIHSEGVDNIQNLPLDWFTKVRCNYKQNKIISGKKDDMLNSSNYNNSKKKKYN